MGDSKFYYQVRKVSDKIMPQDQDAYSIQIGPDYDEHLVAHYACELEWDRMQRIADAHGGGFIGSRVYVEICSKPLFKQNKISDKPQSNDDFKTEEAKRRRKSAYIKKKW